MPAEIKPPSAAVKAKLKKISNPRASKRKIVTGGDFFKNAETFEKTKKCVQAKKKIANLTFRAPSPVHEVHEEIAFIAETRRLQMAEDPVNGMPKIKSLAMLHQLIDRLELASPADVAYTRSEGLVHVMSNEYFGRPIIVLDAVNIKGFSTQMSSDLLAMSSIKIIKTIMKPVKNMAVDVRSYHFTEETPDAFATFEETIEEYSVDEFLTSICDPFKPRNVIDFDSFCEYFLMYFLSLG